MTKIKKGFTLIELLLYMGILSIFLVVLTDVFVALLDVKSRSESYSPVELDGRYILSRISYDLPRAYTIYTPSIPGETAAELSFSTGLQYLYRLNVGNLELSEAGGSWKILNSSDTKVSNLSFQRIGNPAGKSTIVLQFTLESITQGTALETRTFKTTVGLR